MMKVQAPSLPEKLMPYNKSVVAMGNHVIPPGVAAEEINGVTNKLSAECPKELKKLLAKKDATDIYDRMVLTFANESENRNNFDEWKDREFLLILDDFREEFAEKGVKVTLCSRKSDDFGNVRWLEFIDVDAASHYVPQFDVENRSGQVIKTCYDTIEFPKGVAVEELKNWGKNRGRLMEQVPVQVAELIKKKNLQNEYGALIHDCIEFGVSQLTKLWNIGQLEVVLGTHRPKFEAKGVSLFVSHKEETVSHGGGRGYKAFYRWLEFVDRTEQPNYDPARRNYKGPHDPIA